MDEDMIKLNKNLIRIISFPIIVLILIIYLSLTTYSIEDKYRFNPYTSELDYYRSYNNSDFVNSSNGSFLVTAHNLTDKHGNTSSEITNVLNTNRTNHVLFGANVTSLTNWFNGLFNWTVTSSFTTFTGSVLSFSSSLLNTTITDLIALYPTGNTTAQIFNTVDNETFLRKNHNVTDKHGNTTTEIRTVQDVTGNTTAQLTAFLNTNRSSNVFFAKNVTTDESIVAQLKPSWFNVTCFNINCTYNITYNGTALVISSG